MNSAIPAGVIFRARFRSLNMIDQEAEYRFAISRNGLFGGVVFANAETFSDMLTGKYEVISPGAGLGIRIMLNKFSRTNIALDYAWGTQGSRGIFCESGGSVLSRKLNAQSAKQV